MDINMNDLEKIIIHGDTKKLVEKSGELGNFLAKDEVKEKNLKLTTSQIRNFFGTVKKIEARGFDAVGERELLLLKPKLAYAANKAGKTKLNNLKTILTDSIDIVTSGDNDIAKKKEKFNRFCEFFEAILCYHKASGGK